jgi:hypothetical protein
MGEQHPIEHLVDERAWVVDHLLHEPTVPHPILRR